MAIEVITAVIRLRRDVVSAPERLVLMCLGWHANRHGLNAWPAVQTIAKETSLTRRGVQKILLRLRDKGFILISGRMARGSVRYDINLTVLNRERRSQAKLVNCEPRSLSDTISTAINSEPDSSASEPGTPLEANIIHHTGERRSPDPSLNRAFEPSEKKNSVAGATPSRASLTNEERQELLPVVMKLAYDTFDGAAPTEFATATADLKERVARAGVRYDGELIGNVVFTVMNAKRHGSFKKVGSKRRAS